MTSDRRVVHREYSPWAWWVNLILVGTMVGVFLSATAGGELRGIAPWAWSGSVLGSMTLILLIHLLLGGLTVIVETDRIRVGLGRGWPVRTVIPLDEVESLEAVEYRPLRDFGGWGVRGHRSRRVWSARGNQAVRLTLTDGRVLYIGSDRPRILENRIRQSRGH